MTSLWYTTSWLHPLAFLSAVSPPFQVSPPPANIPKSFDVAGRILSFNCLRLNVSILIHCLDVCLDICEWWRVLRLSRNLSVPTRREFQVEGGRSKKNNAEVTEDLVWKSQISTPCLECGSRVAVLDDRYSPFCGLSASQGHERSTLPTPRACWHCL